MTTTASAASVPRIDLKTVAELAAQLRVDSIRCSSRAGSGHPTSSMSAADLIAVLVTRHLRYDWDDPGSPANDHLIFSKGHVSPLLYAVFKAVGVVSEEELINGYRRFGQRLQGHPTPVLPWVDVATGSLGQGLPDGVGVALAGRHLERRPTLARGRGSRPTASPGRPLLGWPTPTRPGTTSGGRWPPGRPTATRWLPSAPRTIGSSPLDGEVSNSTYAVQFAHAYPDRYFEMFIAEQPLFAAATGLAVRGYKPFALTFRRS